MIRILSLLFLIFSTKSYASGGFTWLAPVAHGLHVSEHIITFIFVCMLITAFGLIYNMNVKSIEGAVIPDKGISFRNIFESYGEFIYGQCRVVIGEEQGPKYFGFIATLFLVILMNNLIGLIPGFLPPTENINTTLALGAFAFIYYNVVGCKEIGTVNYLKHFAGPLWYMAVLIFPIEIISNFVRPMSLALRLRGNMMGDHLVLGIFSDLVPALVPIIFMILGLLVSFIQAYVFSILTMVYINLAVASHDHDDHH